MPIICSNIIISALQDKNQSIDKAQKSLNLKDSEIKSSAIHKVSIDARHNYDIKLVISVIFSLNDSKKERLIAEKYKNVTYKSDDSDLDIVCGDKPLSARPVVVGFGPAGMFAALTLARYGYKPVILERGQQVEKRANAVSAFWDKDKVTFNKESNVQFGEGGAGTFSDGKLTTRINDSACSFIIENFIKFGAPKEIAQKAKPHIGTDYLKLIVKNIRNEIINLGGEILFETKAENIKIKNGKLLGIITNKGEIPCEAAIFATGHSARDTFSMLMEQGVFIEPKAFSVGVRIEHLQSDIDKALYGDFAEKDILPKAEYQYSYREKQDNNRGVYTFCMCPGGLVVPSSSEENSVVTNGMSEFSRNGKNANSALVVNVSPEDFENSSTNPLAGVEFQRQLEQKAFELGGKNYCAPFQTVDGYVNNTKSIITNVEPSYSIGVKEAPLKQLFPNIVNNMLLKSFQEINRKSSFFTVNSAILTGPETRTSSPVRITRGDNLQSINCQGLYPCGEGAGYAGGIMSAATDGIKCAKKIINNFKPIE